MKAMEYIEIRDFSLSFAVGVVLGLMLKGLFALL